AKTSRNRCPVQTRCCLLVLNSFQLKAVVRRKMQQHGPTTYTCPEFSSVYAAAACNPIPYLQPQFLGHRHTVVGKENVWWFSFT
ncbi:hypothetical protein ES319_A13G036200v1, partial [Gossypium barbadense]